MNDTDTPAPSRRTRRPAALAWLLLLVLLALAGGYGWQRWSDERNALEQAENDARQRIAALEDRLDGLRRDQRAQAARLQQTEATNRLLRDEVIGLGQRAALVEDSVQRLADPERSAGQALRLDEVELLLAQGQQRLLLAGDLDGARRAYALAAQLLDGIGDPAHLNLRQALAQERGALDALGEDPRGAVATRLEAFATALQTLPQQAPPPDDDDAATWWPRALARVVEVRPSTGADAITVDPADRAAGLAALQLELTLARAAVERRDDDGFRAALARVDGWIQRLWPESPARARQREALQVLRGSALAVEVPTLGSTLAQLRQQRRVR